MVLSALSFPFHFSCLCIHVFCMCVSMHMLCVYVLCVNLRLILGTILDCSSTLFLEIGAFNQTQSSLILLLASSLWELTYLCGGYSWASMPTLRLCGSGIWIPVLSLNPWAMPQAWFCLSAFRISAALGSHCPIWVVTYTVISKNDW